CVILGWGIVLVAEPREMRSLVPAGATLFAIASGVGLCSFGVTVLLAHELAERFARSGWWVLWGPKDWTGREVNRRVIGLGASFLGAAMLVLPILASIE